jgi:uncharacterized delta-60 repeat protein
MKRVIVIALSMTLALLVSAPMMVAEARSTGGAIRSVGVLDSKFGNKGTVLTDFGAWDLARGLAVQPDGKLIAAGEGGDSFALARYKSNGSLDTNFGSGGKVTTDFSTTNAVALQGDGKIVVAGSVTEPGTADSDFALARYNSNGTLDDTFGSGGKVTTEIGEFTSGGFDDRADAVAIQQDGKIVAAGVADNGSDNDFALVRYNPDGSLDGTFDSDGKVTTDFLGGSFDTAHAVALQDDGKIVAGGESGNSFALARYDSNGSLDTSFGSGGKVTTGGFDSVQDLAIQSNGIIAAGSGSGSRGSNDFALARYKLSNGVLDTTFGSGGKVTTDFSGGEDFAHAVALQGDGKIVAGGGNNNPTHIDNFALARYNSNGSPDDTFGKEGKITTLVGRGGGLTDLAIQQDGKIVAAGVADNGSDSDFALARYQVK